VKETMKKRAGTRGSLRMRLTLLTAGVFFVVGAGLLALTYFLVLSTVPPETSIQALRQQEVLVCEQQQRIAAATPHPVQPPLGIVDQNYCRDVFRQAAGIGSTANRSSTLHDLLWFSALGLVVMTGVSAATAWILSGRAVRPLRDITDAAARASRATLGQRLSVPSQGGELKELTYTFNDMLDRLDAAFASQERFVADASHELRTPLTALGAVVDVSMAKEDLTLEQLDTMAEDIGDLLKEAEALLDALLVLSRSDAGLSLSDEVDVATILGRTLDAQASGLTVERDLVPVPLHADRVLLQRAVVNLVDNAVTYNDERAWIRASTFSNGSEAGLRIQNTGPVIKPSLASELFRPFYRAEARTGNGHGLGLAIVRSVVLAHGGRCEAKSRPDGGLTVTLTFSTSSSNGQGWESPTAESARD
jgi:signal transduction histidine kinase